MTKTFLTLALAGLVFSFGCTTENNDSVKDTKPKDTEVKPKRVAKPNEEPEPKEISGDPPKNAAPQAGKAEPGKDEKEFIPEGWKVIDRVKGELNNDSREDLVVQIENTKAKDDDEFDRRMFILLGTSDGKYRLGAEAKKVIRCTFCGGMLGGGPANVKIEKGVLIVSQLYGSREATDYLHRFRYEASTKKFLMIGEDVRNFDRGTGKAESTSTNYLTGKQIVTKEKVNDKGDDVVVSKKEKKVAKSKKYIEDISYTSY